MKIELRNEDTFVNQLVQYEVKPFRNNVETLQLNITKKCNQACVHCHVNAGSTRTEEMTLEVIHRILELLDRDNSIKTVDITGGAPELHPHFRYLVKELKLRGKKIINRCNLTVLLLPGQESTAEFLAENKITIIASLPCYLEENVDYQRGNSVYEKSIRALKILNSLGYGKKDSGLILNLVYNPSGDILPGNQKELELDYKRVLKEKYNIEFNHLLTITNMPINRFADQLEKSGKLQSYYDLLKANFNYKAADKIMCKSQVSVGYDGTLYDCDFNQALALPVLSDKNTVWNINDFTEISNTILYGSHCYGCTAGNGSSCQGTLA
jgi:radical SAM/Cys-rich protein